MASEWAEDVSEDLEDDWEAVGSVPLPALVRVTVRTTTLPSVEMPWLMEAASIVSCTLVDVALYSLASCGDVVPDEFVALPANQSRPRSYLESVRVNGAICSNLGEQQKQQGAVMHHLGQQRALCSWNSTACTRRCVLKRTNTLTGCTSNSFCLHSPVVNNVVVLRGAHFHRCRKEECASGALLPVPVCRWGAVQRVHVVSARSPQIPGTCAFRSSKEMWVAVGVGYFEHDVRVPGNPADRLSCSCHGIWCDTRLEETRHRRHPNPGALKLCASRCPPAV